MLTSISKTFMIKEISAFDTKIHKEREKHIQLISLKDKLEA